MNIVIDVEVEPAESKCTIAVGKVRNHVLRACIFKVNDSRLRWSFHVVHNRTPHGPQLRFFSFGISLSDYNCRGQSDQSNRYERSARVHNFPSVPEPECGSDCCSIRIVRSTRFPSFASTLRVCILYPCASTVISYSESCGTRTASSPRRSETASQRNFFSSVRRMRARAPGSANPCSVNTVVKIMKSWACDLLELCAARARIYADVVPASNTSPTSAILNRT